MTSAMDRRERLVAMAAGLLVSLLLSSCQPCAPIWGPGYPDMGNGECENCGINGKKDSELTVKALAEQIDGLEKHIEKYGSIVPKHVDVWGQARLMMYRQEVERIMRQDAYTFSVNLQGVIGRSDQAFLANAFSLQAAATASQVANLAQNVPGAEVTKVVTADNVTRENNSLLQSQVRMPNYIGPNGQLMIEPTLIEDQKIRYLNHLHQLRRINEGDDNADAPGYGLNLVRIPISVMTGGCTQTGYGAECAFTANLHLPEDLLPTTFRTLVINDLVDLFGLQMTKMIESMVDPCELERAREVWSNCNMKEECASKKMCDGMPSAEDATSSRTLQRAIQAPLMTLTPQLQRAIQAPPVSANIAVSGQSPRPGSQRALPPSQILDVVGVKRLLEMAIRLREQVIDHLACKNSLYYLDVQSALRQELSSAYDFLSAPQNLCLWDFCTPALAEAIRARNTKMVENMRTQFGVVLRAHGDSQPACTGSQGPYGRAITEALAWTIIVDAALLNVRFLEDMKATHEAKGCACVPPGGVPLFLPHPPPEVCQLFNDYVRCRWPLYVFALDPATEDQNIGDSFSLRREMQLALSLAFTAGKIGASNFTRYVRRIEEDIQTISLNRTIIGFSHGDNTFGWRFYPRVQTPPIEGNLENFFIELLWGARRPGYELRRRRLENGIRECVALVIMPSFVPYVDLEVTGNWFRLAEPKCKTLDLKDVMRLSRSIKTIQDRTQLVCDQDHYRPGDTALMMHRLDQLAERLPLQHQLVSVPAENTHGGFELLSSGVTDLGPELVGWYGAPGINPDGYTTLFLVGDNFSVNETRVIVGGRMIDSSCGVDCPDNKSKPDAVTCECPSTPAPPPPPVVPKKDTHSTSMTCGTADSSTSEASAAPAEGEVVQAGLFQSLRCRQQPQGTISTSTAVRVPPVIPPVSLQISMPTPQSPPAPGSVNVPIAPPVPPTGFTQTNAPAADPSAVFADSTPSPSPKPAPDAKNGTTPPKQENPCKKTAEPTPNPCTVLECFYKVPIFQLELLSRQVMRVVIPPGVYSKDGFVDVHIATPYGVSPHISIPVLCPSPHPAPKCADKTKITIPYCVTKDMKKIGLPSNAKPIGTFCITLPNDIATKIGAEGQFEVVFQFQIPGSKLITLSAIQIVFHSGQGELTTDQVAKFAQDLINKLSDPTLKWNDINAIPTLSLSKLTVKGNDISKLPPFQVEFHHCGTCSSPSP